MFSSLKETDFLPLILVACFSSPMAAAHMCQLFFFSLVPLNTSVFHMSQGKNDALKHSGFSISFFWMSQDKSFSDVLHSEVLPKEVVEDGCHHLNHRNDQKMDLTWMVWGMPHARYTRFKMIGPTKLSSKHGINLIVSGMVR